MERHVAYEMTAYPMSLFKDGMTISSDKTDLRNKVLTCEAASTVNAIHIVDGGMLLHKVSWPKKVTCKLLCQQ